MEYSDVEARKGLQTQLRFILGVSSARDAYFPL